MGKATQPRPRAKKTGPSKVASTQPATDPDVRTITQARLFELFDEALQGSRLRAGDLVAVTITATNASRFHMTSATATLRA